MKFDLIMIGVGILYSLVGFGVASINHLIFRPRVEQSGAFMISLIGWPIVLLIDIVALIYRRSTGTVSLAEYLLKLDNWAMKRQRQVRGKDINA